MPVYQYEVADRRGSLSRGTGEAAEQSELITRFRERAQIVLSLSPTIAGAMIFALYLPIFSIGQAMRGGLR
jgi:type II secretory pathway component PulF